MLNTCSIGRRWKPREGWSRPVLTGERGTLFPTRLSGRVSSCGGFFRWMARSIVSCGHDDDTGEAFGCSRPLSGSRTATIGIGRVAWFRFCRPILVVGRYIGFAVVMAQVRRPVPFRTRKLRPGRGDGTALERVWESSTPPHSFVGVPVERDAPGTPFFCLSSGFRGIPGRDAPGTPFFVCLLLRVSRDAREAPNPQHPCIAWSVSVTVSNDGMRLTRYARAGSRESRYDGKRQKPDN